MARGSTTKRYQYLDEVSLLRRCQYDPLLKAELEEMIKNIDRRDRQILFLRLSGYTTDELEIVFQIPAEEIKKVLKHIVRKMNEYIE